MIEGETQSLALVFVDISVGAVDAKAMPGFDGKDIARAVKKRWTSRLADLLTEDHGGQMARVVGNTLRCGFERADDAVNAACAMQEETHSDSDGAPPVPIMLRIGVDVGDVALRNDNYAGQVVMLAARMALLAKPGQIAVTGNVFEHASEELRLRMDPLPVSSELQNRFGNIETYEVTWREQEADAAAPEAPEASREQAEVVRLTAVRRLKPGKKAVDHKAAAESVQPVDSGGDAGAERRAESEYVISAPPPSSGDPGPSPSGPERRTESEIEINVPPPSTGDSGAPSKAESGAGGAAAAGSSPAGPPEPAPSREPPPQQRSGTSPAAMGRPQERPKKLTPILRPRKARATAGPRLILTYEGRESTVDEGRPKLSIGRGPGNDVVLNVDSASRQHADLVCRDGACFLVDHSSNGTLVYDEADGFERLVHNGELELSSTGALSPGCQMADIGDKAPVYRIERK